MRFLVDGARLLAFEGYDRIVFLFDGHDGAALDDARATWTRAKAAGCTVAYWQQSAEGRWEKKA